MKVTHVCVVAAFIQLASYFIVFFSLSSTLALFVRNSDLLRSFVLVGSSFESGMPVNTFASLLLAF